MSGIDIGDTETEQHLRTKKSAVVLLARLIEHHDYSVPFQVMRKPVIIEIETQPEPAQSVPICILPIEKPRITVDAIMHVVARFFGITHSDIISDRRTLKIVFPRQVAMYLSKKLTTRSLPFIGRKFGDRDHTTVHHAVHKIERLLLTDSALAGKVASIEEIFAA